MIRQKKLVSMVTLAHRNPLREYSDIDDLSDEELTGAIASKASMLKHLEMFSRDDDASADRQDRIRELLSTLGMIRLEREFAELPPLLPWGRASRGSGSFATDGADKRNTHD